MITHCFFVEARDYRRPDIVDIAFRPVESRLSLGEIAGVLRVGADRLPQFLTYRYVGANVPTTYQSGGWATFAAAPNGTVLVDRWMNYVGESSHVVFIGGRNPTRQVLTYRLQLQERASLLPCGRMGLVWTAPSRICAGEWWTNGQSFAGAVVSVAGSNDVALSDTNGEFRLTVPVPERYRVSVRDTTFAKFGLVRTGAPVTMETDDRADAPTRIALPPLLRMAKEACGKNRIGDAPGAVLLDLGGFGEYAATVIRARWSDPRDPRRAISTPANGHIALCGLRGGQQLELSLLRGSARLGSATLTVAGDERVDTLTIPNPEIARTSENQPTAATRPLPSSSPPR